MFQLGENHKKPPEKLKFIKQINKFKVNESAVSPLKGKKPYTFGSVIKKNM